MKKVVIAVVVLAVLGAVGWQVYRKVQERMSPPGGRPGAGLVPIEIAPVSRTTIRDMGVFTGSLEPRSQFLVAAKIAGRLEKLLVNVGDPVTRGQEIARLDDAEFTQEVEQAKAELEVAQATAENCASDLEVAEREFERSNTLYEKKIASESELDAARAQYNACMAKRKVSLAVVVQREAALKGAQVRLAYAHIEAWWEKGDQPRVIGERFLDEGALVKANEPIVSILEDCVLIAAVYASERDYPKLAVGQPATVTTEAWGGRTFPGCVVRIAPLLKESSRQGRVEVEVPNPNPNKRLWTNMFVEARIEFGRRDNVTVVPSSCLVKRDGKQGVYLADPEAGTVRYVPVKLGIAEGELVEVTEPALDGWVVTLGQHLLSDESKVVVTARREIEPAGAATTRPASEGPTATTGPDVRNATTRPECTRPEAATGD